MKLRSLVFGLIFTVILFFYFSYRITTIPPGLNQDEASIGYNALLIGRTLRDENNRLLPVFILTLGKTDWKQPLNIYSLAALFKILPPSINSLRTISVIWAMLSVFVFWYLLREFFDQKLSLVGIFLYSSSPLLLIHSHLAMENISLLPFFNAWLLFLIKALRAKSKRFFFLSGIILGFSFYTYKGMHGLVLIYLVVSFGYLVLYFRHRLSKMLSRLILYLGSTLFFLLPIKYLYSHYGGALYDPTSISPLKLTTAVSTYLSAFDLTFLFAQGDRFLIHSTGQHGVFLFPSLVSLLLGISSLGKQKNLLYILFISILLATPLIMIPINSTYRASRLLMFVPLFTILFTLGVKFLLSNLTKIKTAFLLIIGLIYVFVFIDFLHYYWFVYPLSIVNHFPINLEQSVQKLKSNSLTTQSPPAVSANIYQGALPQWQFYEQSIFEGKLQVVDLDYEHLSAGQIILATEEKINSYHLLEPIPSKTLGQDNYYIHQKLP